jgi:hypothetical protein
VECENKDFVTVVGDTCQDSIVSGASDAGLGTASQNGGDVSPSPVGLEVRSDETLVSSVSADVDAQRACDVTVGEASQTDTKYGSRHTSQDADDGDDFGDFSNPVTVEEFAVFESPLVDGPAGGWATATRPAPAEIDNYDFDDFESAEFQCAPVNCVGFDDGKVSINCVTSRVNYFRSLNSGRSIQPFTNSVLHNINPLALEFSFKF